MNQNEFQEHYVNITYYMLCIYIILYITKNIMSNLSFLRESTSYAQEERVGGRGESKGRHRTGTRTRRYEHCLHTEERGVYRSVS